MLRAKRAQFPGATDVFERGLRQKTVLRHPPTPHPAGRTLSMTPPSTPLKGLCKRLFRLSDLPFSGTRGHLHSATQHQGASLPSLLPSAVRWAYVLCVVRMRLRPTRTRFREIYVCLVRHCGLASEHLGTASGVQDLDDDLLASPPVRHPQALSDSPNSSSPPCALSCRKCQPS